MASTNQPLLYTPKKTTLGCKILFYSVIAILVIAFSAVFLVPNLFKTSQNDLSVISSNMCRTAIDPEKCRGFVTQLVSNGETSVEGITILQKFLMKYAHHIYNAIVASTKLRNQINDENELGAISDCLELMDLSIDQVKYSVAALENRAKLSHLNAQTWLSGVLTNHVTCLDGLKNSGRKSIGTVLDDLILRARAALAMAAVVPVSEPDWETLPRSLLPSWISLGDRKLLQSSGKHIKADLIVAKDGTGNYTKVADAVAAVPDKSKKRYVIYVKKGTYEENVEVGKKKVKLMIVGDGMDSTVITGDLNVADGSTTFKSATLAAVGEGFILQDICIQNTAGPEKHQAVALRVGADQSVINRCKIDAYQDTLYTHSLRQFYRDSYITGTVDFIFGNAAVVFQNCKLVARKPMKSQKNMVTAQGRIDPNQNTGTSIQYCEIIASDDLEPVKSSFPTYLGRPWKEYSRTVVMQSNIGDLIDPAGWAEWNGDFALKTLYYGEYMNSGAGAGTSKRVNWTGYHVITDPAEAMKFTVKEMIQGGEWLSSTGVTFAEGL
ncbi:Pectinesterase/pectinesterase inhibitor 18 [Forsythia ovata]|uniref:Pectinesterase n=1 Tax=Forsythia ovata TaxID=205694 RepID=A0ABD1R6C2_9LAMI